MSYYVLNRGDEVSLRLTDTFHQLAGQHGMVLDEEAPNIVVSIGGDGTLLHAFQMFRERLETVSFVGIHTGRLGFYADWQSDEIEQLVSLMANSHKNSEQNIALYPIIEIQINTTSERITHYALNEFTIKGIVRTLVAKLHVNDELFETFRGDGILISSPSGSTAYNKSLGGALIHPSLESMQITEIASINNRVFRTLGSSIVLPKHHYCHIIPKENQKIMLSLDHLHIEHEDIVSIRCCVAEQKVRFARYRPFPFWDRVKAAFISNEGND